VYAPWKKSFSGNSAVGDRMQFALGSVAMRAALIKALINAHFLLSGTEVAPDQMPEAPPELQSESFEDWAIVCGKSSADPSERVCEVTTMIFASDQTAPFARIALLRQRKAKPMRVIAIMPVAISIPRGVQFALAPGEQGINLTYKYCAVTVCFAEAEIDEEQLVMLRKPLQGGRLAFSDPAGKEIEVGVSFRGLAQALDVLLKR
jgi:invasion protein IalB